MPSKPGPGYLYKLQPSGQWSPVAFGPLSGPLHLRRSKLTRWPLEAEPHTTPFLSMSPPRMPKAGSGTLYTSDNPVLGSKRRNAGGPPKMPVVYQIEPSTGLGITAYGPEPGTIRLSFAGSIAWFGSTYSSRLPLALVSRTNGDQPCAFAASPVSSSTLVLIQPATGPVPLSQSVLFAS